MRRLIDADVLVNTIVFHTDLPYEAKEVVEDVVNDMPSVESNEQWIPCDEITKKGYPKEDGYYYVTEKNYDYYLDAEAKQKCTHVSYFKNGDFRNRHYQDNYSNITAWIKLPDPYGGKPNDTGMISEGW